MMDRFFISGAGVMTENINSINQLFLTNIDQQAVLPTCSTVNEYLNKSFLFQSKNSIAREDRSLLNKVSQLAIDVSMQAFKIAESCKKISDQDKEDFLVFTATEVCEYGSSALDHLLKEHHDNVSDSLDNLGKVKAYLSPLDMLRLLSTNSLYHLSKVFGLRGGGYPIKRMSLSGLCAVEGAITALRQRGKHALITAVGNMTIAENLCVFAKMGLVKTGQLSNGITPSYGAASLIIEKNTAKNNIAEIVEVKSIYKNKSFVTKDDWLELFSMQTAAMNTNNLHIVLYNNGIKEMADEELNAINQFFPNANHFSYKPYAGYTGKANNLVDLVIALMDNRIPVDSHILINGVGTTSGMGCMLIKKLNGISA